VETVFLELMEALEIHRDQLERYGGKQGLVDLELLTSALAAPSAGLGEKYVHQGPWEMAAAYLYYIINLHPFVDGNLRVGTVTPVVFLELNGFELEAGQNNLERLVREVALGKADKTRVADFFRRYVVKKAL